MAIALHDNELDVALTIEALIEGPQVCLSLKYSLINCYTNYILF